MKKFLDWNAAWLFGGLITFGSFLVYLSFGGTIDPYCVECQPEWYEFLIPIGGLIFCTWMSGKK